VRPRYDRPVARPDALSIVIPTWCAAAALADTLTALHPELTPADELVVADAASPDGTAAVAAGRGGRIVVTSRGRGVQLAAGAAAARSSWCLFLHADSRPAPGWRAAVAAFAATPAHRGRAAYFRLRFDDAAPTARRFERLVAWRSRRLGLPYGDQGLLIERAFYHAIGGFRALPLMEDVDLARRIGRRRLIALDAAIVTSAARYRRAGYFARGARNLCCLALYYLRVPPLLIAKLYE